MTAEPRPVDEGAVAVAEVLAVDRMAHYGYTPEQIAAASVPVDHNAAGCLWDGNWWDCTDEDGEPNHPDADEMDRTAEFVMWILEHPDLADLLAAAEQRGREAAWDEGYAAGADHWGIIDPPWDEPTNPYRERADREASDGGR